MRQKISTKIAFCGVLAALMVVIMLLGTLFPLATYACPAVAGALLIPAVWEFGAPTGWVLYAAAAILTLLLCPDKEAVILFLLLLGWYPALRPTLQHLSHPALRLVVKLLLFNLAIAASYLLLLFVLSLPDLVQESAQWTGWLVLVLLLLGNITFLLYDLLLARLTNWYVYRLRARLRPFR